MAPACFLSVGLSVLALRSRVALSVCTSQCVTVAPPRLSNPAMGVPTIRLLPTTTAVFPTTPTPCMASKSTTPSGVHARGRNSSCGAEMAPCVVFCRHETPFGARTVRDSVIRGRLMFGVAAGDNHLFGKTKIYI